jgi:hypothetical protein
VRSLKNLFSRGYVFFGVAGLFASAAIKSFIVCGEIRDPYTSAPVDIDLLWGGLALALLAAFFLALDGVIRSKSSAEARDRES